MIISLAHALGVDNVAEGVENRAQRDALGHLGCTHLQGFLYSRAVPPDDAARMLAPAADGATELDQLLSETLSASGEALLPAYQRRELHQQVEAAITTHYHWLALTSSTETAAAGNEATSRAKGAATSTPHDRTHYDP